MEKSKRLLTLVAIVAVVTISGVALALNPTWFIFLPNYEALEETPHRVTESFDLEDQPDFFEASVVIEGSGYTEQLHTVDITISHNRPDSSIWLATGDYFLDLEQSSAVIEPITNGSFTDLRITTPFVAIPYAWTPTSPADSYDIVLSLSNIIWTRAANIVGTEYTETGPYIENINSTGCLFNGSTSNSYTPGAPMEVVWTLDWAGPDNVVEFKITISFERTGGNDLYAAVDSVIVTGTWTPGDPITITEIIDAPPYGDWIGRLFIWDIVTSP